MDDLIYSFLLQSDYPRSSIVFNFDLLNPVPQAGNGIKMPSFIIVDPVSAEPLAVIEVVDAIDKDELKQAGIETGAYAARLGGNTIQGFVIRVDVRGRAESEQVQFYRIWPNSTLQQLSSRNFPDLETLRVARRLYENASMQVVSQSSLTTDAKTDATTDAHTVDGLESDVQAVSAGAGLYLPALALLVLVLVDGLFTVVKGTPLLSVPQSLLAFGAAFLLTLPAAIRYVHRWR